jgi:hypothetical protein
MPGALVEPAANAEIHEDNPTAPLAHDVVRLHVAVHDARLMDGRKRAADVLADQGGLAVPQRARRLDFVGKRPARRA